MLTLAAFAVLTLAACKLISVVAALVMDACDGDDGIDDAE